MFSNDEKITSAKEFRRKLRNSVKTEMAKADGLNRKQRRKFGSQTGLADLVQEFGFTWGRKRSDFGKIPVSDEFIESRILERFVKRQCSDSEFETRMNAWLSDPAEFSRIVYDYADNPNMIEALFGKSTAKIILALKTIQSAAKEVQRRNTRILKIRADLIEMGTDRSAAHDLTKQLCLQEAYLGSNSINLGAEFGEGRNGHFNHYLKQLLESGYSIKKSDVMDLMQMCYAYDCDLFRCDKAMAYTFRNYEAFNGKLVGRFKELPDRIDKLLTTQSEH